MFTALLSLAVAPCFIYAQTTPSTPAAKSPSSGTAGSQPANSTGDFWSTRLKHPTKWLSLGADLRLREEYHNNALTFSGNLPEHEYNYQRYRLRFSAKVQPVKDLDFNVRLTTERRSYVKPDRLEGSKPDEFIFDSLNVTWRNVAHLPMTLTAGRQEITLGNAWLVLEGNPLDGSRTIFFDALRLTYTLKQAKTTVDVIGISQASASDRWIAPLHSLKKRLIEQNENGAILYVTNKSAPKTQIDGYFIYKHDMKILPNGNNSSIYAFGARVERELGSHWKCRTEWASELGKKNGQDLQAFGTNNRLSYFLKDQINQNFRLGYEFLSGDNPATKDRMEGFDPLWGRWPQWTELLLLSFSKETRAGDWTNWHRLDFGWSCNPSKKMELNADYMPLFAASNPFENRTGFSRDGRFRGHFASSLLKYKFSDHMNGHLLGELFRPGSYYSSDRHDLAMFLRAEMIFIW